MPPKVVKNQRKTRIFFGIFASSGIKAGLELKYVTKITSIIGSDKILNRPHVCSQPPTAHPICVLSI